MVFADGFWEAKSLTDWLTLAGLPLALFSIWFSWWLATRDIEKRIADAQRETIGRLSAALLQPDVAEASRCLHDAREACRGRRWERAIDRCEQASHRIPRFRFLPGLDESDRERLDRAVDQLRLLIRQLEEVLSASRPELTGRKLRDLDDVIATLAAIEGKIRASGLR
jgi:hypothetical protein